MCGRFACFEMPVALLLEFDLFPPRFIPRYNIAPTQHSLVVYQEFDESPVIQGMLWGLVPFWAKDTTNAVRAINARSETVESRQTYREAFKIRRCLVPVTGFYEWRANPDGKTKTPYYFTAASEGGLVLAGLWERWRGEHGEIRSFAILTTAANATVSPIHDRMPVILRQGDWAAWIDPENKDRAHLKSLLAPAPDDALRFWGVSPYVNNPKNEGEKCIDRAG